MIKQRLIMNPEEKECLTHILMFLLLAMFIGALYIFLNLIGVIHANASDGIVIGENVSDKEYENVYSYYSMIPECVRNEFVNDGWTIIISKDNFGKKYGINKQISGLTVFDEKIIYIAPRKPEGILHEMGHYMDWKSSYTCEKEIESSGIYAEELDDFLSFHNTDKANYDTPREYFAECYEECFLNPDVFIAKCPKTFNFICEKQWIHINEAQNN